MTTTERSKLVSQWRSSLQKGIDFDSWGMPVECGEEYQLLSRKIHKEASSSTSQFDEEQKKTMTKIATCLELRARALQAPHSSSDEFKLEDLKKVESAMRNLLVSGSVNSDFPVQVPSLPSKSFKTLPSEGSIEEIVEVGDDDKDDDDGDEDQKTLTTGGQGAGAHASTTTSFKAGTLLPRLPSEPGMTLLTIQVEKIGLKEASSHIDPFITVSVKDVSGVDVTAIQETAVAAKKEDPYIIFGVDVEIQKPIEKLPKGSAIFFELKHYKPKKKITSTKGFAFMELDEIRQGSCCIEIYKKPTDFKRKKLSLLTTKSLYLHLNLTLHTSK